MKTREADEAGRASGSFVASRRSRIVKTQKSVELSNIRQDTEEPRPSVAWCGRRLKSFEAVKSVCGHCPRFGCRTGSYMGRIGPNSACFPEFPMIAGAGMQFESHLGHVFPQVRGRLGP